MILLHVREARSEAGVVVLRALGVVGVVAVTHAMGGVHGGGGEVLVKYHLGLQVLLKMVVAGVLEVVAVEVNLVVRVQLDFIAEL